MVEEAQKLDAASITEGEDNSSTITKNHHNAGGELLEVEEGEIVGDDSDDAVKSMVPPETRHPMEHSWTFWFDNPVAISRQATWGINSSDLYLRLCRRFLEVTLAFMLVIGITSSFLLDDSVYNNIHQPSTLQVGADFHCFKHKIEPKWDDLICSNGGKWTVAFPRGNSDTHWLHTLLAMIGEQFDYGDEICGAVVNVRAKQDRISIWTKNAENEAAQMSIGRRWKEFLDYKESIGFIVHDDAKKLDWAAKNRYTV